MTFVVGQSKVRAWRACRAAYHLKHERKLVRIVGSRPLTFGKVIHRMLEEDAQEGDPFAALDDLGLENEKLFDAEREMYGDLVEDARAIMAEYFRYHQDGLRYVAARDDETGELRFSEHEFAVPLAELAPARRVELDGIEFRGQVDALAMTPNRLRWLVEHKTFDNLPSDDDRWRNVQTVVYRKAIVHLGWLPVVDGVCWNYIRSKPPTRPQLLKDGSRLSVQKIVTLPSVVLEEIRRHKLSEESHAEHLSRARDCLPEYFRRVYQPVAEAVSDSIFDGFVDSAVEMRDSPGRCDKNIGRHCSWCDYEPICRAELTGGDVDFTIEREYQTEEPDSHRRSRRSATAAPGGVDGASADASAGGKRVPKLRVLR